MVAPRVRVLDAGDDDEMMLGAGRTRGTHLLLQQELCILVQVGVLRLELVLQLLHADLLPGELFVVGRLFFEQALDYLCVDREWGRGRHREGRVRSFGSFSERSLDL